MLDNTNVYLSNTNSKNHLEVFKSQHDWSDQAEERPNYALVAFLSDSE
ncbi:hypothetical protein Tco_0512963, partial [Tanacetum coccineum]